MSLAFLRNTLLSRTRRKLTSKDVGNALESRVVEMLRLEGARNIRRNVFLRDSHGNRSEVDIVYGYLFPTYVECKNYAASSTPVPLSDVAKFKSVLQLNSIPVSRGLFITTSSF